MSETVNTSYQLLPPLERAHYFSELIKNGSSVTGIARQIGKSLSYVSNTIRLLDLPSIVKDGLVENMISEGHARALLALRTDESVMTVYRQIIVDGANVRQTEAFVRSARLKERSDEVLRRISE